MPRLTAVDIGTHSVKILVGEPQRQAQTITVLGRVKIPCFGVRRSEVIEPEKVSQAIAAGLDQIRKSGIDPGSEAWVSVGGSHLYAIESHGLVSVSRADQTISEQDIERVLQASRAVNLPSNKEVLDVFPQDFIVDGEGGIADPLGLKGVRLEVETLLVCAFSPVLENLARAVEEAGLGIADIQPAVLASANACLTAQQKELGCALVDIGSGTCGIAFYDKGRLIDFSILPVGSANITNDLAIGLRCEIKIAEALKKKHMDLAFLTKSKTGSKSEQSKNIEMPEAELCVSKKKFDKIIGARVKQIFSELNKKIKQVSKHTLLPAGIVFCGGGSLMPGLVDYAKQELELPAFLGKVNYVSDIQDPSLAAAAGLLLAARKEQVCQGPGISSAISARIKKVLKMFLP